MLPSWCLQKVTIIRPGTKESRGSTVPDWDNVEERLVRNCSAQPASTGLSQDGRVLGITEGLTIYMPPNTNVQAGDHVRIGDNVYAIIGEPKRWVSATGRVSHVQLNVERWNG